jgi:hypothetical protein
MPRSSRVVRLAVLAVLAHSGCDVFGGGGGGGGTSGGRVTGGGDASVPLSGGWTLAATPCPGSKTNALWFDSTAVGFAGCGENAEGAGLFRTADGGRSWDGLPAFDEVRVVDLRRGPDGVLYAAGIHRVEGTSAWRIDEAGGAFAPVALFAPGNNAFTAVKQAENVAVAADGQVLVDSLTGTSAAYRAGGGDSFLEVHSLDQAAIADPENALGVQVRRIVAFDDRFYAAGSVINEPAQVFLPSALPGATFHLESVALQPASQDGELLDLHLWSATRMIAAGWDQSTRDLLVFVLDGDARSPSAWTRVDLAASGIDYPAGVWDLSVVGDVVVAVGEKVPTSAGGCVLRSADGGRTWADITPVTGGSPVGPLSAVWLFPDGDIFAAGGGREAWRFTAD